MTKAFYLSAVAYLRIHGKANTVEIQEHIAAKYPKRYPDRRALANFLSGHPEIRRVGYTKMSSHNGSVLVAV